MSESTKTYEIGGKTYELVKPVFGVLRKVGLFARSVSTAVSDAADLCAALDDQSSRFVALMLTPQGVLPQDRDIEAIAMAVEWGADGVLPSQVVVDFFDQPEASPENMIAALSVTRMVSTMAMTTQMGSMVRSAGTTPSKPSSDMSQNSPEATPSSESKSSGDADTPT